MDKSAIILAGGFSKRFGSDKGLVPLVNKPLIRHVLDAVSGIVEEEIVVVSSKEQAEKFAKVLSVNVKVVVDKSSLQSPLVGALTGFEIAVGEYALLLPCDAPLVSRYALSLLLDLCVGKNAVIPRWPNGYVEPLHAVYQVKPALEAAENALKKGRLDMRSMIERLRRIRYVSTLVFQQLDPELKMFFNINTPLDLKRAELMLNPEKSKRGRGFTSSF
ncbi:MAG: molybdenum cofactor guanylyltransferase [Candidatus Bathyarchaeota archaeon]|nr:molybdenum cofactor guanylyltransferase [Candidatus Bathyarchaeota archaeon A05DMB-3]MDH7607046.1 molybdenum cofactor guanylyltransferase [Candidatus Bathyarchaeota archaeon]